ncbi:hyoscyamine 6-dioxygenase-like [Nicotiana tabacum]|uniref:Hyoscyamine 6-dioxygenase-like n=2 Tax=Nicotiana TaxID=4085 RepID=A0A1S3YPD7_TOBAC|nr:PREDICTED: hyoscyamine 6-dioxygenase-like [Nicotiana sylvestris]XP_016453963.1 PREDICTED: hyoscyamine 6-dioxygenase-like [Nicotiana tabacum]
MEKNNTKWFSVESVPQCYTFSPEERPGEALIPICKKIPVIDIGKSLVSSSENLETIKQLLQAGQEFGFFQVINHGILENVLTQTMSTFEEFFDIAGEQNVDVSAKKGWIYTGSKDEVKDGVHLWRDNIKHPCHPLEKCMQSWPDNPASYRKIVGTYVVEVRKLSLTILELICQGLGIEAGYFEEQSRVQLLSANNYPACPDPTLTLGIPKHLDPSLITIIYQGNVSGLQVMVDGQWMGVGALPNAFVVNIGNQLEIISNGKLRSVEHRVVTNSREARTSIAIFVNPAPNCIVEPAKVLLNESNPPLYNSILYRDFINASKAFGIHTDAIQNEA